MTDPQPKRHSKLGIASCLTALAVWSYFGVMFYLVFYVDGFSRVLTDIFVPESRGMTDLRGMGVAVVLFAGIFFIIPAAGHLIGFLFAVIGLFFPGRLRLFPVGGLILNILPMLILIVLFLIGSMTNPK